MTWFKVDDSFHSHPKVLAAEPAALGLWVVAGAWCSANLTDGFVPDYVLPRLLPDGTRLAGELVTSGLWRRAKGGYRFHDWSVYQPTKEEATAQRDKKSSGGALGNHRRWHVGTGKQDPRCVFCQQKQPSDKRSDSDRSTDTGTESPPNPPDPTRPDPKNSTRSTTSTNGRTAHADEPPTNDPPGPAEQIMTRWATRLTKPAQRTIAQAVGAHIHQALADGVPAPDVAEALDLWQTKVNSGDTIGPGILPTLIHQVSQRAPGTDLALPGNVVQLTDRRPSTTDARVGAALALAAELAAEEVHRDAR